MASYSAGKLNTDNVLLDEGRSIEEIVTVMLDLPTGFAGTLDKHIKRLGLTNEGLAEAAGLTDKIIRKYRKDEEANPEITTVMALCVGLNLEPELSEDLIAKAGYKWKSTKKDIFFRRLLWNHYDEDLYTWNERLEKADIHQKLPRN